MISQLTPQIRALMLDMDGVLWHGEKPIVNLPRAFDFIRSQNIAFIFTTNNSTSNAEQYVARLKRLGVEITPAQIISSGIATAMLLKEVFPSGAPVFVVGEKGLVDTLEQHGFYLDEKNAVAVIVGLDREVNYEKLSRATLLIRNGAAFYGANNDSTFITPDGQLPGAGSILAAIETATNTHSILVGKPQPLIFSMGLKILGSSPETTLAIGDRLDTDILGAQRAGCRSALVLSGVSTVQELEQWSPQPDLVAPDLEVLLGIK